MAIFGVKKSALVAFLAILLQIAGQLGNPELAAVLKIVGEAMIALLVLGGFVEADSIRKALSKAKIKVL
ncbi:MAG TPA: hypothetical protein PKI83_03140 [Bacteroidales bacterium]|nr:hypothetical protein [Bacteroidales bacterium]